MIRSVFVLSALVACSKPDPGPTCAVVMAHLSTVMAQGMTGHDMFGNGKHDVEECTARNLTALQRTCLLATKTMADIASCQAGRAHDQEMVTPPVLPTTKPR